MFKELVEERATKFLYRNAPAVMFYWERLGVSGTGIALAT